MFFKGIFQKTVDIGVEMNKIRICILYMQKCIICKMMNKISIELFTSLL